MGKSLVSVRGVLARGTHGANPGERDQSQEFVVDFDVDVDVGSDTLEATADYRTLTDVARKTVETTSFVLLESLAEAVASALAEQTGVSAARVTIHKPAAARSLGVDDVAAAASSERLSWP